ncbi:MAG: metal-binding protein [Microcystaceae cyanobacterium]
MPSGRTHDRLIWWGLPFVIGITYAGTRQGGLTVVTSVGYLFSGLMFGPDLDIHSVQYKRWGWLRWVWLPYRQLLRHRSYFSHGFLLGTLFRLLYVATWGSLILLLSLAIARWIQPQTAPDWLTWGQSLKTFWQYYGPESIAFLVGLELGAMNHAVSDYLGSTWFKPKPSRRKSSPLSKSPRRRRKTKS